MDAEDTDCVYHIAYTEIIWGIFRVQFVAQYQKPDLEIKPYRKSS